MDKAGLLECVLNLLRKNGVRFCAIGGQAVNASRFKVEEFPHSLNISTQGSDLRIQIQTDPRYAHFVDRSSIGENIGDSAFPSRRLKTSCRARTGAASDPERPATKRRKDLLDIERILEANPQLRSCVPDDIQRQFS